MSLQHCGGVQQSSLQEVAGEPTMTKQEAECRWQERARDEKAQADTVTMMADERNRLLDKVAIVRLHHTAGSRGLQDRDAEH